MVRSLPTLGDRCRYPAQLMFECIGLVHFPYVFGLHYNVRLVNERLTEYPFGEVEE